VSATVAIITTEISIKFMDVYQFETVAPDPTYHFAKRLLTALDHWQSGNCQVFASPACGRRELTALRIF
jgi:hypothetical protein